MMKLEVVGNLGADAELKMNAEGKFISFRIAHTNLWTDKVTGEINSRPIWVSCSQKGDGGGILKYLKKGTKVFVRGNVDFKVYSSAKTHSMEVGINLFVREIELCGFKEKEAETQTTNEKTKEKEKK